MLATVAFVKTDAITTEPVEFLTSDVGLVWQVVGITVRVPSFVPQGSTIVWKASDSFLPVTFKGTLAIWKQITF